MYKLWTCGYMKITNQYLIEELTKEEAKEYVESQEVKGDAYDLPKNLKKLLERLNILDEI